MAALLRSTRMAAARWLRLGSSESTAAAAMPAASHRGGAAWAPSCRLPAAAAAPRLLMGSSGSSSSGGRRRWLQRHTRMAAFHSADGRPAGAPAASGHGSTEPDDGSSKAAPAAAAAGAADPSAGSQQEPPHMVNWQTGVVLAGASFEAYGVLAEPGLPLRSEQGTVIHFIDGCARSLGQALPRAARDGAVARCWRWLLAHHCDALLARRPAAASCGRAWRACCSSRSSGQPRCPPPTRRPSPATRERPQRSLLAALHCLGAAGRLGWCAASNAFHRCRCTSCTHSCFCLPSSKQLPGGARGRLGLHHPHRAQLLKSRMARERGAVCPVRGRRAGLGCCQRGQRWGPALPRGAAVPPKVLPAGLP